MNRKGRINNRLFIKFCRVDSRYLADCRRPYLFGKSHPSLILVIFHVSSALHILTYFLVFWKISLDGETLHRFRKSMNFELFSTRHAIFRLSHGYLFKFTISNENPLWFSRCILYFANVPTYRTIDFNSFFHRDLVPRVLEFTEVKIYFFANHLVQFSLDVSAIFSFHSFLFYLHICLETLASLL